MNFYGQGYVCANCGSWVGYNQTHTCTPTFHWQPMPLGGDPEIKELLKRIVELLEKLTEK